MNRNFLISLALSTAFFIVAFVTIPSYNISWDEILHFSRGQVYLNYFLTGSKEYPKDNARKSYFQIDYQYGDFWFKENGGHPPVSDILVATSNYLFYQKLGILSDIGSYHLYDVLTASLLVFVVVYFSSVTLGVFPAVISFLALVTYPLFFAESHFNVKDIPETAFFATTILFFYLSLHKKRPWYILIAFLFFVLGLGTKFNILFLPFIVGPYLLVQHRGRLKKIFLEYAKYIILGLLLTLVVFIVSWPFLWGNLPQNLIKVFYYYKNIGTGTRYQPDSFYLAGFNTFPFQWILFTTPPVVLLLTFLGLVSIWLNRKSSDKLWILWLLWLLIPIIRVSLPGTSIYGGIRQVLEFLPALALISAMGARQIVKWSKGLSITPKIILVAIFIWPIFIISKMHPNENIYFNSLIGGLSGAYARDFPSWGNSYGNAYMSGIKWLNQNAPPNSRLALIQGTRPNAPPILLRSDISLDNKNWTGTDRGGEYLMELIFNDTGKAYYYKWEYVDKFLEPVYELKVDEIAILKIWKNDIEHTRKNYRFGEKRLGGQFLISQKANRLSLDMGVETTLLRTVVDFKPEKGCTPISSVFVETSIDNKNWLREKDWIPFPQVKDIDNLEGNRINYYFAARDARYIRFILEDAKSCVLDNPKVTIYNASAL